MRRTPLRHHVGGIQVVPLLIATTVLLLSGCGGSGGEGTTRAPALEDAVEWVGRIPSGEVPSDYLLARLVANTLAVEESGDVLVLDEDWIKVYAPDGRPQTRFGGPGDGPGELRQARRLFQSPEGYLTAFGVQFGTNAHVFRPDRSYVASRDFMNRRPDFPLLKERNLGLGRPGEIYAIDDQRWVYSIEASDLDRNRREHLEIFLIYETPDSVRVIADYLRTDVIVGEGIGYDLPSLGWLYFALLPNTRVAWCHTFHDVDFTSEPAIYTIHVMDLISGERTEIRQSFERIPLVWSPRAPEGLRERNPEQYSLMVAVDRKAKQRCLEQKFEAPIGALLSDGRFLFAMTHVRKDTTLFLFDVFDGAAFRYLCSVWLPGALIIRDGYLYQTNNYLRTGEEPAIDRYRLRPEVYGRRK